MFICDVFLCARATCTAPYDFIKRGIHELKRASVQSVSQKGPDEFLMVVDRVQYSSALEDRQRLSN